MRQYFAYIRVSTQKQGDTGASLQEQRAAIEAFAKRERLAITEWFEERTTAAKLGRPVFRRMFALLNKGKAHGVIIHKIDRGARNLSDWADLAKLMDKGIELRFANDNLDMQTRGGRLAADIQAVVAADYIRNLREEVLKGMYGRLRQGFYPLKAPLGYLDNGSAQLKTICPTVGPQIRRIFELYATGNYSLRSLAEELARLGIRGHRGRPVTFNRLGPILSNPFYYGLMKIKRNGQTFVGNHEPLISKTLFDRVQAIKGGQIKVKTGVRHSYVLQRMIRCGTCTRSLYAEKHKGRVYYRCQTRGCSASIREDRAIARIARTFGDTGINDRVIALMHHVWEDMHSDVRTNIARTQKDLAITLANVRDRDARLVDAYLERAIDKATLDERRTTLHNERLGIEETLAALENPEEIAKRGTTFLELVKTLKNMGEVADPSEVRKICRMTISNFTLNEKSLAIAWHYPFSQLFFGPIVRSGAQYRDESIGSGNVRNGGTSNEAVDWTDERVRKVLKAVILGRPQDESAGPNDVPTSPSLPVAEIANPDATCPGSAERALEGC